MRYQLLDWAFRVFPTEGFLRSNAKSESKYVLSRAAIGRQKLSDGFHLSGVAKTVEGLQITKDGSQPGIITEALFTYQLASMTKANEKLLVKKCPWLTAVEYNSSSIMAS